MKPVVVIARQELGAARRERLAVALLAIFLGMVMVSSAIGWATHRTVTSVYNQTLASTDKNIPNPFAETSPLDVIKNTIIYVVLIGALLSIVVGVRSSIRERKAGVTDLIFSRPISQRSYAAGKLLGTQAWMGIVLIAAMFASWVSVWVVVRQPLSVSETLSLLGFFALAWLFLLPFSAIGVIAGARSRNESTALLVPLMIWVAVTFVIPQLGTAQNPSSLLNPVPTAVSTSDLLFRVNKAVLQPVSFSEHFRHAGASLLQLRGATVDPIGGDLVSLGLISGLSVAALGMVSRSAMRRPLYE